MAVPRFKALCRALGYSPRMIEQQIFRGLFTPGTSTTPGKAREWSLRDTAALIVFQTLFGAGMAAKEASQLSHLMPFGAKEEKLLLAWRIRGSDSWTHDVVELAHFSFSVWKSQNNICGGVFIDLAEVARQAHAAFELAARIEQPSIPTELSSISSRGRQRRASTRRRRQ